jgi:Protein of unknown function (DUF4240)
MTEDEFWAIIEETGASGSNTQSAQKAALLKILSKLETAEVVAFDKIFVQLLAASNTWDLWGAAYIIDGGCSDDGFEYFRRGLIASGRERFEKALQDPESLADWAEPDELEFEDIKYVAYDVYQQKTGSKEIPSHNLPRLARPSGEEWSEDGDDLEERFPKLWAKFNS